MWCGRYNEDDTARDAERAAAAAANNKAAAEKIAGFFAGMAGEPSVEISDDGKHTKANKLFLTLGECLLVQHRGYKISVKTADISRAVALFREWRAKEMVHVRICMQ